VVILYIGPRKAIKMTELIKLILWVIAKLESLVDLLASKQLPVEADKFEESRKDII
jgi:hypothetical protein